MGLANALAARPRPGLALGQPGRVLHPGRLPAHGGPGRAARRHRARQPGRRAGHASGDDPGPDRGPVGARAERTRVQHGLQPAAHAWQGRRDGRAADEARRRFRGDVEGPPEEVSRDERAAAGALRAEGRAVDGQGE